jgi:signal transduction histidine kinase
VPHFSVADTFFVLTYLLIFAGLSTLPQSIGDRGRRIRLLVDGSIGALSIGTLLWAFALRPIFAAAPPGVWWQRALAFAYPLFDVAMIVVMTIVIMRRSAQRFDRRLLLFGLGMAIQTGADLSLLVSSTLEGPESVPNHGLFILAGALLLMSALNVRMRALPREYPEVSTRWWPLVVPYVPAVGLVVMLLKHLSASALETHTWFLVVSTNIVASLVLYRQAIAIRENRREIERQRHALISSISHELRTPLTAVVGFLDLIVHGDQALSSEERHELAGLAHQQATYMSRITGDLVLLARRRLDQVDLRETEFEFEELFRRSMNTIEARGQQLSMQHPAGLRVHGDLDRLQQVLVNLVTNACRYGGSQISLVAEVSGRNLIVEVHDNGPGVPRRYELAIWERFERGAYRLNGSVPGSGIGLAVVDTIARAHRGKAGYRRSERLGGACFYVQLPGRAIVPAATSQATAQLAPL